MTKGALVRSQIAGLERLGWREDVYRATGVETRSLFDDPPSLVTWIRFERTLPIVDAVFALRGLEGVVTLGKAGSERVIETALKPVIQGIFAVFGATPHSLFTRSDTVLQAIFRGIHATYRSNGESSGELEIEIQCSSLPVHYWHIWIGSISHAFTLTRVEGAVDNPRLLSPQRAAFALRWGRR